MERRKQISAFVINFLALLFFNYFNKTFFHERGIFLTFLGNYFFGLFFGLIYGYFKIGQKVNTYFETALALFLIISILLSLKLFNIIIEDTSLLQIIFSAASFVLGLNTIFISIDQTKKRKGI